MNRKSIRYMNHLNEVTFILVHREILKNVKKIANPRISCLAQLYEMVLDDLEKVIQVPSQRIEPGLNMKRIDAYNVCRMAVISLKNCPPKGYEKTLEILVPAFSKSVCRKTIVNVNRILDGAQQVLMNIPRAELDFLALGERMARFVRLNEACRQSQEAKIHNRQNRKKGSWYISRSNCVSVYRCILDLVENLALLGNSECQNFQDWLEI